MITFAPNCFLEVACSSKLQRLLGNLLSGYYNLVTCSNGELRTSSINQWIKLTNRNTTNYKLINSKFNLYDLQDTNTFISDSLCCDVIA